MYEDVAVELTKEFIRMESFSVEGKQKIIAFMYHKIKEETDAEVQIVDGHTENLYLIAHHKNGEGYHLLLQGHLDTVSLDGVQDPLNPIEKDGEIYGRGSCDMKAGSASNYAAFKYACDHQVKGDVYLMYSTDEETYAQQTVSAFERGLLPSCDIGIISEPTNQTLMVAQKGNAWIEVEFIGKSAHSSMPELGENAIYMASAFIQAFQKYTEEKFKRNSHPLLGEAKMNVGAIEAGKQANSVPANCRIVIDKRYLPNETINDFQEEIDIVAKRLKDTYPVFRYQTNILVDCTPMEIDSSSEKFLQLKALLEKALDRKLEVDVFGGWGEGGTLAKYATDTLYFGPGNSIYAHTDEERVGIEAIKEVTSGIIAIVKSKCV
ncbi:M20 family metallopeptidase [Oceanobacillus sp. FSL K6-0251]|uniref:M20 family metallopeptidase n=1 Tax=Oceanobacillus sp. FSL K6-0251 TaxID=2921602 RepID=UPI0030F7CF14